MNTVNLIGRLTKDVTISVSAASQNAFASFGIAIERGKDKDGKDKGADFPNCKAFGKTAEVLERYTKKGDMVGISGHIQTGAYTDKEGRKVYTTDVIVDRLDLLTKKDAKTEEQQSITDGFTKVDEWELPF